MVTDLVLLSQKYFLSFVSCVEPAALGSGQLTEAPYYLDESERCLAMRADRLDLLALSCGTACVTGSQSVGRYALQIVC